MLLLESHQFVVFFKAVYSLLFGVLECDFDLKGGNACSKSGDN